ncbi:Vms1/Ankzf1 family peptidyl-tRNA hydrolase [Antribacter gilvus]|uniref:baeRF2 domain-containing protein n=1 Tax=Antribacter gilvus TaxID=2304675 RepID=UPI000F7B626E|nr:Vms1/Ankzf1 family peptidyl-tRNA hydrolase [Antribacter gilvus]
MKIDWLHPLIGHPGPFATLFLDATPAAEAGDRDVANRWRAVRKSLAQQGAPEDVLGAIEEVVLRPLWPRGLHGRVVIADGTGVLVDRPVKSPPAVASSTWGPVPALLQAALAADESVELLCVSVDRQGADFVRSGVAGKDRWSYEAPHDEIVKSSSPGSSRSNIEARAEDSWERNAEAMAAEIERQVAATRPELVVLTGDVRAVNLVRAELSRTVADRVVEVAGGGRNEGVRAGSFEEHLDDALDSYRERRREQVLAELRQGLGRESGAVTSVDDVVAVLARGQVKELVLAEEFGSAELGADVAGDGRLNGRTLWIGPDPLHIAGTRGELEDLGVTQGLEELPAAIALVRAAVGEDAGLTFAPEGSVDLIDGVGATLRWHDEGTPNEALLSMSGDDQRK